MMHGQWNNAWCGDWMGQSGYMGGGPTGFFGSSWSLLIFGFAFMVIVGLLIWLASSRTSASPGIGNSQGAIVASPQATGAGDTAESIARERYARGEITAEQYGEIAATLRRQ